MFPIELLEPSEIPDAVISEAATLIMTCETVQPGSLLDVLKRAYRIALMRNEKAVIGTAVIKNPYPQYRDGLIEKSGFEGLANFPREFGYVCIEKSIQEKCLGTKISGTLLNWYGDPLYATTLTDNNKMQNILRRFTFSKVGGEWDSGVNPGKQLEMWVRSKVP